MSTRMVVLTALLLWVARPFAIAPLPAQDNQTNRPHRYTPDACGPVDPNYIHIAEESGGQPMFLQRAEAAQAGHFMREMSGENHETLLWAKGVLQGDAREFTVPVDASVERVTFALSTDTRGTRLTVFDPGGAEFTVSQAGAQISDLSCGRIVTAAEPERGEWRVRVSGSGRFWVQAGARTEIFLTGVQFVAEGGRPGHEGMFRIPGQPLADRPATLETNLSGPAKNASFELISKEGDLVQRIEMRSYHQDEDEKQYSGSFDLPSQPFRLRVTGVDTGGHPYQRIFHTLFHAESVEVAPTSVLIDSLPPGQTTTLTYTVRNVGSAATFRILVVDTRHFVTRVEPKELSLEKNHSGKVEVDLTVPGETPQATGFDVTITATSLGETATRNGASQHLSVFAPQKP